MATSKLKYSGLISTQNRNKSLNEVHSYFPSYNYSGLSLHSNQSPPFSLEHNNRLQRDTLLKTKYSYTNPLDKPSLTDKANQEKKSLFSRITDEHIHSEKPNKGHQRVKSSITTMYQKNVERMEEERSLAGSTLGRYQESLRRPSYGKEGSSGNGSSDDINGRLRDDNRIAKEIGRESRNAREEKNSNGMGILKEGKSLGEFLAKDGGFGRRMSPEEPRTRKKEVSINHDFEASSLDKRNVIKSPVGRSPQENTLDDITTPKAEFISTLDDYIDYFRKTDRSHRKLSKGAIDFANEEEEEKKRFHPNDPKDTEIRLLRSFVEELNKKINEMMKVNRKLVKEFTGMLTREQESIQRITKLEEDFGILKSKNKKYREKLKLVTKLLEKEKTDNQSNLLALKTVLSNGINMALENKVRRNIEGYKEKYLRDEVGPRNTPVNFSKREDRKEESHGRKSSEKKQSQKREDSVFVQKSSLFSDDSVYMEKKTEINDVTEEEKQETSEQIDQETENMVSDNQDTNEYIREQVWSPQKTTYKETIRDQQIRALQEKIIEMMESQQKSAIKYKQNQEKLVNQQQSRIKYHTKHLHDVHAGNYDYKPITKEFNNSHLKVQGFFPRY